jgi:hypothetical protein
MYEFDMKAFHRAVDERRRERGLSWTELAAEVNRPFEHTPSIPINPATIRDTAKKSSVTSAVVLQVLRWLCASPERFLAAVNRHPFENEELPHAEPYQILRFDTRALYAALDHEYKRRGMTWKQIAAELPGFTPTMLTNLANGPLIGFPRVMLITQWLKMPAARFVRPCSR